jgi:histidinol dehydrogenase
VAALREQIARRQRRSAIEQALRDWSAAIVAPDEAAAHELVDLLAAEHVTLAVRDPANTLAKLRHGGAWFLGDRTPVASGDYYAGPSHCLPTGTTARFTSGLSVYTFLKRSSVEHYPSGPPAQAATDIAVLAEAEGLDGHAESVRIRAEGTGVPTQS